MMRVFLCCIFLTFSIWPFVSAQVFRSRFQPFINPYPKYETLPLDGDPGEPLFVTPYLEKNQAEEARSLAKCNLGNVESYSGYFTVNKTVNSNMFFWYFPSENRQESAPVVLWLQGGPGASSLFGLFEEHGPFSIGKNATLKPRKYSWTKHQHMIYIDNPVGTGFSFTDSDSGYANNEVDVGANLYEAVQQFFDLFPHLRNNAFYVTGESYGGKYVPALSYTIHKKNPLAEKKINFQGLAIGNGLSDPENQLLYGSYLYQLGLIDDNGRKRFQQAENETREHIEKFEDGMALCSNHKKVNGQHICDVQLVASRLTISSLGEWSEAFSCFDNLLNGDMTPSRSLFYNLTGFTYYFNYLQCHERSSSDVGAFVQRLESRKALHVGNSTFHTDNKVEKHLIDDVMQSVRPWIEELLLNYRALIYNGQLDIIVAYPLTVNYLRHMNWIYHKEYLEAERNLWCVGDEVAGYYKQVGYLTEVLVRNAGHMVPSDMPKWAYDLISRFVNGKSLRNDTC